MKQSVPLFKAVVLLLLTLSFSGSVHSNETTEAETINHAIESVKMSILSEPNNADLYYALGTLYLQQGDAGAAKDAFFIAVQNNPDHVDATFFLGNIALMTGKPEFAVSMFQRVLSLDPSHEGAQKQLATIAKILDQADGNS